MRRRLRRALRRLRDRATARREVLPRVRGAKVVERATPSSAPRDYTPRHLAEKILQSKSALEGERKQVTVLFADVQGSVALVEQVDPEKWHGILDRFFEILSDGVHRFEETVNQYTGDGIMALCGAPIAHEDHAQRACYALIETGVVAGVRGAGDRREGRARIRSLAWHLPTSSWRSRSAGAFGHCIESSNP